MNGLWWRDFASGLRERIANLCGAALTQTGLIRRPRALEKLNPNGAMLPFIYFPLVIVPVSLSRF